MWKICRGELRNLANRRAEFGKICRGKLLSLPISRCCIIYCVILDSSIMCRQKSGAIFGFQFLFYNASERKFLTAEINTAESYREFQVAGAAQGHREFPFWKSKIPPLSVKIPIMKIPPILKVIKVVIYLPSTN